MPPRALQAGPAYGTPGSYYNDGSVKSYTKSDYYAPSGGVQPSPYHAADSYMSGSSRERTHTRDGTHTHTRDGTHTYTSYNSEGEPIYADRGAERSSSAAGSAASGGGGYGGAGHHHRNSSGGSGGGNRGGYAPEYTGTGSRTSSGARGSAASRVASGVGPLVQRGGYASTGAFTRGMGGTEMWLTTDPRINTVSAPDLKGRLENALDNLSVSGSMFLGRFSILSSAHRREGGQGIVQFARGVHDGQDYAIKCAAASIGRIGRMSCACGGNAVRLDRACLHAALSALRAAAGLQTRCM
jgi:hypothetical protein